MVNRFPIEAKIVFLQNESLQWEIYVGFENVLFVYKGGGESNLQNAMFTDQFSEQRIKCYLNKYLFMPYANKRDVKIINQESDLFIYLL